MQKQVHLPGLPDAVALTSQKAGATPPVLS